MKNKIAAALAAAFATFNVQAADVAFTAEREVEPTAAIPVFKIRQGEKFKLFDGIGGGIKWTPGYDKDYKDFHMSALVMLSSSSVTDKTTNTTDQANIMAGGLVLGYSWFQVGVGRDLISSESKEVFSARSKWFLMLNLAGKITF
jgi:hypothetical protein